VIHFWWLVKADITLPRRWAFAVAALLGFRLWWALKPRLSMSVADGQRAKVKRDSRI
jgi:DMSO/TMAO reductase YedYZ heme-binding membrane subunit